MSEKNHIYIAFHMTSKYYDFKVIFNKLVCVIKDIYVVTVPARNRPGHADGKWSYMNGFSHFLTPSKSHFKTVFQSLIK